MSQRINWRVIAGMVVGFYLWYAGDRLVERFQDYWNPGKVEWVE